MPILRAVPFHALADVLRGLLVLVALWGAGEGIAALLPPGVPLTGSLWGMLLLFAGLASGAVPEAWVRRAAAGLVRVLGLLFVPVGVGIVAYGELVAANLAALVVALVAGSVLTLGAAALAVRAVRR